MQIANSSKDEERQTLEFRMTGIGIVIADLKRKPMQTNNN
jgi:hypothetical protein